MVGGGRGGGEGGKARAEDEKGAGREGKERVKGKG